MFNDLILWFDSLPFFALILVTIVLLLVEFTFCKDKVALSKYKKWLLINAWQVFGVLFPVMWLLRVSENYIEVVLLAIMIIFFGVYKPTRFRNKT